MYAPVHPKDEMGLKNLFKADVILFGFHSASEVFSVYFKGFISIITNPKSNPIQLVFILLAINL